MQQLKKILEANNISNDEIQDFFSKLEYVEYQKNECLLKPKQTEKYLYFIEKGLLRFFIEKDDREITFDFAFANNFASGYSSFLKREPSLFSIQALADTNIWRIEYNDLQSIYNGSEKSQMIGRLAAEQLFIRKTNRELSFLTLSAEERYLQLLNEHADMIQQIPLKYLASYIGITPQALSRIRKRIY